MSKTKRSRRLKGTQPYDRNAACYKTLIPRHRYQATTEPHVYECEVCHHRLRVEMVPFGDRSC